ncbi:MAG: serine/threonine protein kinase, partial [Planctomycetes bacterium]|nr:serine/threonine protein kinase [Planctomycetota bacterium]
MDLTPEQFRLVATIFAEACEIPEKERHDFLDRACGEDAALRTQVQQLLDDDAQPAFSLESPPFEGVLQAEGASYFENQNSQAKPLERIGNYRIVKVLGEGGFGVVYLAEQENPKRNVALKVVKPHMGSSEMLRRFEYEARLLGRLRHPGIAHIYEAGTVEFKSYSGERLRRPFFAMELIRGKRLTTHADDSKLGTGQRLALLQKVCEAVHHAHLQGVIHRDLKPDNILVDDSGQPKILDFGVARAIDSDIQMTTLRTDIGQLIGTIPYMSPEQVLGDSSKVDIRSDVYAMGVIGYQLLAGRLPHDLSHKTVPEAVRIIRDVQP